MQLSHARTAQPRDLRVDDRGDVGRELIGLVARRLGVRVAQSTDGITRLGFDRMQDVCEALRIRHCLLGPLDLVHVLVHYLEMGPINVHDAKTHFSKLLERVAQGEEITLAKAGKPVAKLVPIPPAMVSRAPGSASGEIQMSADFDAPLPEGIQSAFG